MYIQTTTRCNMRCGHCIYSCTSVGEDMAMDIFKATIDGGQGENKVACLAGGEPTLHPRFWDMVEVALGANYQGVWVSTNGSRTDDTLRLAKMAKDGILSCQLSRSQYHADIDQEVVDAFDGCPEDFLDSHSRKWTDGSAGQGLDLRMVSGYIPAANIIGLGRAARIPGTRRYCKMDNDYVVDVRGVIHRCFCKDSEVLGHVFEHPVIPSGNCTGSKTTHYEKAIV